MMLGNPRPGDLYYQEVYPGEAEDMGAVISLAEPVAVVYGSFADALVTADHNPLDDQLENKFYAPGVGAVKEILIGGDGGAELVSISHDSRQMAPDRACGAQGGVPFVGTIPVRGKASNLAALVQVSGAEVEAAALAVVGEVAVEETELEVEDGFLVYEVELDSGQEVLVDAGDGMVLLVETD
jgi:hypothetical protein